MATRYMSRHRNILRPPRRDSTRKPACDRKHPLSCCRLQRDRSLPERWLSAKPRLKRLPVSPARLAKMITKKGSLFPSTKPLNSVFIRITRQRHGLQFLRSFNGYFMRASFEGLRPSTSGTAHKTHLPYWRGRCGVAARLIGSLRLCYRPTASALALLLMSASDLHASVESEQHFESFPTNWTMLCGNSERQAQLTINILQSRTQQIHNCELPRRCLRRVSLKHRLFEGDAL